jgi:hypothetical protein
VAPTIVEQGLGRRLALATSSRASSIHSFKESRPRRCRGTMRSLRPLPMTRSSPARKSTLADVEAAEFAHAKSGAVEDLADRPIKRRPLVGRPSPRPAGLSSCSRTTILGRWLDGRGAESRAAGLFRGVRAPPATRSSFAMTLVDERSRFARRHALVMNARYSRNWLVSRLHRAARNRALWPTRRTALEVARGRRAELPATGPRRARSRRTSSRCHRDRWPGRCCS